MTGVTGIAARLTHQVSSFLQVSYNLVIYLAYRVTLRLLRTNCCAQRYTQIVLAMAIGTGIQRYQMQVEQTTHEVSLTQYLLVIRVALIQRTNHRVTHVDGFVGNHPQGSYVLQSVGHHVRSCLVQRVCRVR